MTQDAASFQFAIDLSDGDGTAQAMCRLGLGFIHEVLGCENEHGENECVYKWMGVAMMAFWVLPEEKYPAHMTRSIFMERLRGAIALYAPEAIRAQSVDSEPNVMLLTFQFFFADALQLVQGDAALTDAVMKANDAQDAPEGFNALCTRWAQWLTGQTDQVPYHGLF